MQCLEPRCIRSCPFLLTRGAAAYAPLRSKFLGVELPCRIECFDALAIERYLRTSVHSWNALRNKFPDSGPNLLDIVVDERIGEAGRVTLLAAVDGPDERSITRIELIDTGFLLDHFGTVQAQARLPSHDDVARKPGGEGHSAKAPHGAGDNTDDRSVAPQGQNGRHDFRDGREPEIGFLQTHTACLEQQHR